MVSKKVKLEPNWVLCSDKPTIDISFENGKIHSFEIVDNAKEKERKIRLTRVTSNKYPLIYPLHVIYIITQRWYEEDRNNVIDYEKDCDGICREDDKGNKVPIYAKRKEREETMREEVFVVDRSSENKMGMGNSRNEHGVRALDSVTYLIDVITGKIVDTIVYKS